MEDQGKKKKDRKTDREKERKKEGKECRREESMSLGL